MVLSICTHTNTHTLIHIITLSSSASLEMLDKVEPPSIPEGYAMSVAFSALLDLVRGITSMIERELAEEEAAVRREANPDQNTQPEPGEERAGGWGSGVRTRGLLWAYRKC